MLSQTNRLKKTKEIRRVFQRGSVFKEAFLLLKLTPNSLKATRFAFVVGKNVSKKAVERNKLKRRMREVVRLKMPEIKKGFDAVFIASRTANERHFGEIEVIINKLLKKAKLI